MVPLLGENRTIVKNGLVKIQNTNNHGIKALLRVCGLRDRELNTYNVAFMLAPINAAGRIDDAGECLILLTDDAGRAMEIAKLDSDNKKRQAIENEILNGAEAMIGETVDIDRDKAMVLCSENWHVGVIVLWHRDW